MHREIELSVAAAGGRSKSEDTDVRLQRCAGGSPLKEMSREGSAFRRGVACTQFGSFCWIGGGAEIEACPGTSCKSVHSRARCVTSLSMARWSFVMCRTRVRGEECTTTRFANPPRRRDDDE